jgi:hypothetical protein
MNNMKLTEEEKKANKLARETEKKELKEQLRIEEEVNYFY